VKKTTLCGIVTGMEHSGTTLLSQLLNAHPDVAAGVESGILLANLHEFNSLKPYWDWLSGSAGWGWCLLEEHRDLLLDAESYADVFQILGEHKGKNNKDLYLRALFQSSHIIYDKTPAYVFHLTAVLSRIDVPCCITMKSWPETFNSYCIKRQWDTNKLAARYEKMLDEVILAKQRFGSRILVILYRSLAHGDPAVMRAVGRHFALPGKFELSLASYNRRFGDFIVSKNSFVKSNLFYDEIDASAVGMAGEYYLNRMREYESYFREKFRQATLGSI